MSLLTLLIIVVILVLLFGGGWGYRRGRRDIGLGVGGLLPLILVIFLILYLTGRI